MTSRSQKFGPFSLAGTLLAGIALAGALSISAKDASSQERRPPGPLSPAHSEVPGVTNCSACHTPEQEAPPQKCLACHEEIARQPGLGKGYHRDKADDCAVCHAEHQGADVPLVPLDREDFDHEETGTKLSGAHLRVDDCDRCHRPETTLPRKRTRSFILNDPTCRGCHQPPHPGRQDDCLSCHNTTSWIVDGGGIVTP